MTSEIYRGQDNSLGDEDPVLTAYLDVLSARAGDEYSKDDRLEVVQEGGFVKLYNNFAGQLLDYGRPSAYAIHLTVIRLAHASKFVLNEKHCAKQYGINRRGFRQGIGLMQQAGLLERDKNGGKSSDRGRRFASERWLIEPSVGFVLVPRRFVAPVDTFALGFYVATCLWPSARRPLDVAKRIGISSEKTVRQLLRLLRDDIAISSPVAGPIKVARPGHPFQVHPSTVITCQVKPRSANSCQHTEEVRHPIETIGNPQKKGRGLGNGTFAEANALEQGSPAFSPMPEYLSLSPWQSSYERATSNGHFIALEPRSLAPNEELLNPSEWRSLLQKFGGAPVHLGTANALNQATAIAIMLADDESEISRQQALRGVGLAICRAVRQGRTIRSLGFIATILARLMTEQNRAWALEYPTILSEADDVQAMRWVEWGLGQLRARGLDHDAEQLRGTRAENTYGS